jgi:hypothetical protein
LRAGSFETTRELGGEALNVSQFKFYRGLKCLKSAQMISTKVHRKTTIVTVLKWGVYQGLDADDPEERTAENAKTRAPGARQAHTKRTAIREKNGKNGKNPPSPRKRGAGSSYGSQNGKPDPIDELLDAWLVVYRGPHKRGESTELRDGFAELMRHGWTDDAIRLAITDRTRTRTEWPSTFFARLMKGRPAGTPPPESMQERTAKIAAKRQAQAEHDRAIEAERDQVLETLNKRKTRS